MYKKVRSPARAERAENVEYFWAQGNLVVLEKLVPHDRQIVTCSLSAAEAVKREAASSPSPPDTHASGTVSSLPTDHVIDSMAFLGVYSHPAHKGSRSGTCPESKYV